jgi:hypothetical protein
VQIPGKIAPAAFRAYDSVDSIENVVLKPRKTYSILLNRVLIRVLRPDTKLHGKAV